ncbi:polymer-forming cytoskeletal protein [Roseivirga sp. BDSF3-8]|uniref:bactofilin family protein n=1 Tax=Roseivirga sp. BDSF3-8 TaxID=3241598 RepID=UPI00353210EB
MFNKEEKKAVEQLTNSSNTIGKGTTITGDVETFGNIRIDGKIVGNIKTKSKVVLGPSSEIDGNILAQNAEIEGEVKGKIEVSELLILKPSAVIHGDIMTNKLVVEAGAVFNGGSKMGITTKEIRIGDNEGSSKNTFKKETKSA